MKIVNLHHRTRDAWLGLKALARKTLRETDGATAIMFSFLTVVLTGSLAFGIDSATWYQTDRKLQTAADMAAMAAAADQALQQAVGYNGETVATVAQTAIVGNGVDLADLTILQVNSPPTTGPYAGNPNAVEIVTAQNVPIFFAGAFLGGAPQAQARAVALSDAEADVCVLALHPTLTNALLFSGSSDVQLDCGVGANSSNANAVRGQGSANAQVTGVRAVGGITNNGSITGSMSPYANPVANPFADLVVPAHGGCDYNNRSFNGQQQNTINPGVYCGNLRFNAQSTTTMNPGEYFMDGGDMIINGQAKVYGDDVTIFFTNSSDPSNPGSLQANGGSDIRLTGALAGTYKDVLFMRDPDGADVAASNADRWIINGSSDPLLDGAIYAPGVEVEMSGSADPTGGCFVIIAGAVTFTGSVDVQMTCANSNTTMAGAISTSLVE